MIHARHKHQTRRSRQRTGFTLLELMLALALIVVATALIGSLMQLFSRNFATRGDDIRRQQLARAILNMMAEDIRGVVMKQEYDTSVLEKMLGGSGSSGSGGGGNGDTEPLSEDESSFGFGDTSSAFSDTGTSTDTASTMDLTGDGTMLATTSTPPGIYGNQFSLMLDVSRIPRPEEYIVQQTSLLDGTLTDVPGDMKTVTYYVQAATNMGVNDTLNNFASDPANASGFSSGLVRRQLDRAVTAYAEEMGDIDRLSRTGDLVAPEVIAVEFSYFDGVQWLLQWDSSTQSLPWLVQISLAMQSATASELAQLEPGTPISTMTYEDRSAYGIEVYELVVAIPGAQLTAADAASADQAAGMESMGLQP